MEFCEKCGAQLKEGAKFCAGCGAPVETYSQQPDPQYQQPVQPNQQYQQYQQQNPVHMYAPYFSLIFSVVSSRINV